MMRLFLMKFIDVHIKVIIEFIGKPNICTRRHVQMTDHCTVRIKYKEQMSQAMEIITDKWNALKSFKRVSKFL